ncbi:MAG: hypothetical protein AAFX81_16210 [Pseudomonadota bacterium]
MIKLATLIAPGWLTSVPALAGNQPALAIGGYDTVSYFEGEPQRGEACFSAFWNGAIWYLASEASHNAFVADPERYAPADDGYCSWAASQSQRYRATRWSSPARTVGCSCWSIPGRRDCGRPIPQLSSSRVTRTGPASTPSERAIVGAARPAPALFRWRGEGPGQTQTEAPWCRPRLPKGCLWPDRSTLTQCNIVLLGHRYDGDGSCKTSSTNSNGAGKAHAWAAAIDASLPSMHAAS